MLLTSIRFIGFVVLMLVVFNLLPARRRALVLLAGSYGFYAAFSVPHLLVLCIVTLTAFAAGTVMSTHHRHILPISIVAVLLPLLTLKYSGFMTALAAGLFGIAPWPVRDIALPLGISFFTFQAISYLADVHHGIVPAERNLTRLALYLAFFPKLLAGPIERATDLVPQLRVLARSTVTNLHAGAKIALWGFFCKLVVADNLASIVDSVLNAPQQESGATLSATFVLWHSFQIYFDFLGYTNIAIGIARCFDIHLSPNFNLPYAATSLREFWRRWHISLSSWFRDYLYVPLGGNATHGVRRFGQLLVVFVVSGLWHGAAMTFVAWGAFHGIAYATEDHFRRRFPLTNRRGRSRTSRVLQQSAQRSLTFVVVTLGWVVFRLADFSAVRTVLGRITLVNVDVPYLSLNDAFTRTDSLWFFAFLLGALAIDGSRNFRAALDRVPQSSRHLAAELAYVNGFAVSILLLGDLGVRDFTYFQF